ncbi:MAG: hypothetical protein LBV29_00810 [Azoarcus sp.]|nr:hypothetical protein [Azoarcus sp.]
MNALVGQEAKANHALFRLVCDKRADDGSREDGGDFARTGAGGHLRRGCQFEVLHDGSGEYNRHGWWP